MCLRRFSTLGPYSWLQLLVSTAIKINTVVKLTHKKQNGIIIIIHLADLIQEGKARQRSGWKTWSQKVIIVLASHCIFLLFVDPQCKTEFIGNSEDKISNSEIWPHCGANLYVYMCPYFRYSSETKMPWYPSYGVKL